MQSELIPIEIYSREIQNIWAGLHIDAVELGVTGMKVNENDCIQMASDRSW